MFSPAGKFTKKKTAWHSQDVHGRLSWAGGEARKLSQPRSKEYG